MNDIESLAASDSQSLIQGVLFRDPDPPSELIDLLENVRDVWYLKPSDSRAASGVVRHDIFDARTSGAQRDTSNPKLQGVALTISDQVLQDEY